MPFFNATHLPTPTQEYVAWIDVMGTQASMQRSIDESANFIFKLHVAALEAPRDGVTLYPVMDGLYASSTSQEKILSFINAVYVSIATEFNKETQAKHRFLIRGGLAFGQVIHGNDIPASVSDVLEANPVYRGAILLGMPVVQAHSTESAAPPFGLSIHESARAFAPSGVKPLHVLWWKWPPSKKSKVWTSLRTNLEKHFTWCEQRSSAIGYAQERIRVHKQMFQEYFAE
jgi:hypothetical protein